MILQDSPLLSTALGEPVVCLYFKPHDVQASVLTFTKQAKIAEVWSWRSDEKALRRSGIPIMGMGIKLTIDQLCEECHTDYDQAVLLFEQLQRRYAHE